MDERWLSQMMNVLAGSMENNVPTYKGLARIMTDDNLHFIHEMRNRLAVMTDPDFEEGGPWDEIYGDAEEIPSEFLRGLALGIATALEADIRGATAPMVGRMHREMVPLYEAVQSILIERSIET